MGPEADLTQEARRARADLPPARSDGAGRDAAAALALGGLCAAFFWKAVSLQGVFFYYDHALQNFPYRLFFAEGLRRGRLPLWTPHIFCGFPLFAESQGNALYPPFLILFGLLPPWVAYNYYTVLHFWAAGLSAYVLARTLHIGRAGALVGGAAYMMAGPVLFHAHHTNIVVGAAWLPLLLAMLELFFQRRTAGPLVGLAAGSGMLALGAQPQYTLYGALVCGLYALWRLRLTHLCGASKRTVAALAASLGAAALLGALLAAVQLVPLAELVAHSSRGSSAAALASPGLPGNLITLWLPHYFGSPGLGSYWGARDTGPYSELTLFIGVTTLMLAAVGALADRSRRALFFAALGAFAMLFSLEYCGAVYYAFALLPVFRSSRLAPRFAYVAALCAAMLAGGGLEEMLASAGRNSRRVRRAAVAAVAAVLGGAIVCLLAARACNAPFMELSRAELAEKLPAGDGGIAILWRHFHGTLPADALRLAIACAAGAALALWCAFGRPRATLATGLWLAAIFCELAFVGREFSAVTDPRLYQSPPPLAALLKSLPPGRILEYRYYEPDALASGEALYPFTQGYALEPERYASCLERLPHNSHMMWGIPSAGGFCPLQTVALKALLGQEEGSATLIEFLITPPLDLLGVRYVLSPRASVPGNLPLIGAAGGVNVFENGDALPRAFIVHKAQRVPPQAALSLLQDAAFDYRGCVLVHDSNAPLPQQEDGRAGAEEWAQVTADAEDAIRIRTRLSQPGYLVLADQHYPGWRATVDGRPAKLWRVNYVLKGVYLDVGEHNVVLEFRPASVQLGLALTLAGLAALAACAATWWGRRPLKLLSEPEQDGTTAQPHRPAFARLVVLCVALFAGLGLVLGLPHWRGIGAQLSPKSFALSRSLAAACYKAADGDAIGAYKLVRDTAGRLGPQSSPTRELANLGVQAIVRCLQEGRAEEARAIAAELSALAPEEFSRLGPALRRLAEKGAKTAP